VVPQQLPLHWLCENTFGDELANVQRILCADPIQLLRALQKCLTAFVDPQRDTATSNIAGYMDDILSRFPAFSELNQAFDTFRKAAQNGTEAEFSVQQERLRKESNRYKEPQLVILDSVDTTIPQEIVPTDKIAQILQHKSLTREQKATLVQFILKENGFLSDKFLSTKF
jgi:hypothetical protein